MPDQLESLNDRIILNGQTIWLHPPQRHCWACRGGNHIFMEIRKNA